SGDRDEPIKMPYRNTMPLVYLFFLFTDYVFYQLPDIQRPPKYHTRQHCFNRQYFVGAEQSDAR
ncbi:hypothetical protein, partial [Klebsiella oxytoca]